eukprot:COSAG04_NODE_3724_length_2581_cov_76.628928_3_plen_70_part_00
MTNTKQQKPKCKECGKSLVLIGRERQNGKGTFKDWKTREYHKKCYKLVQQRRMWERHIHLFHNSDETTV